MKKTMAALLLLTLVLTALPARAVQKEFTETRAFNGGELVLGANPVLLKTKRQTLYLPVNFHFGNGMGGYTTVTQSVAVAEITYKYHVYRDGEGRYYSAFFDEDDLRVKEMENELYDAAVKREWVPVMHFTSYGASYGGHIGGGSIIISYCSDIYYDQHHNVESKTRSDAIRAFGIGISSDD